MSEYLSQEERFLVATKCCIFHNEKILIVGENKASENIWWELPGGKISKKEKDATITDSLVRELEEELGNSFGARDNARLFAVEKRYEKAFYSDEILPFVFLCFFLELDAMPEIQLSEEHQTCRWIREDEIGSIDGWRAGFDEVVKKAFQYQKE